MENMTPQIKKIKVMELEKAKLEEKIRDIAGVMVAGSFAALTVALRFTAMTLGGRKAGRMQICTCEKCRVWYNKKKLEVIKSVGKSLALVRGC